MAEPKVPPDATIGVRAVQVIGSMHTPVLERSAIRLGRYGVFSIRVRDAVCRCGHGQSAHRWASDHALEDCVACESARAIGNRLVSGSHRFSE